MKEKIKGLRERLAKQAGFTLVELMVVLIVLVLIVLIAIPVMGNILDNAEDNSYASSVDMVEKAAELAYTESRLPDSDIESKDAYTVDELVEAGYLDLEVPATYGDETIAGTDTVERNGSSFNYTGDDAAGE